MKQKFSLQRIATFVSSTVAFLLMVMKLVVGIFSGSVAVLSSAIDSMMDLFVSTFNNFAVYFSEKKPDRTFNYGRGKIEAVASLFEGIIITVSGLYILYVSLRKFVFNEQINYLGASLAVMVVSIIVTLALVLFQDYVVRKTDNLVIKSDMLHYKTDLFSNGGILIGLLAIKLTGFHLIDAIIGVIVAVYITASAWDLIKNGFLLLLDVSLDKEEVEKIQNIIKNGKEVTGYHYLKTRESGSMKFVEVHIVFNKNISLLEAHNISDDLEQKIREIDKDSQWDVMIHLDPYDDRGNKEY